MKKYLFIILLILISFNIFSETKDLTIETKILTLKIDDAVNLAMKNNLNIESEYLKIHQKEWAMYTSWNIFIPNTNLSGAFTRSNKVTEDERKQKITGLKPISSGSEPIK